MPSEEFLDQYNINLARTVALGSQLRLRYEQETKLRRKVAAKVVSRDSKIEAQAEKIKSQADEIKNLRALIEAEADMKKAAEAKNAELDKELLEIRAQFAKVQLDNQQLVQQVSTLQAQVTGEEKIKAAFEEFKKAEDERVPRWMLVWMRSV